MSEEKILDTQIPEKKQEQNVKKESKFSPKKIAIGLGIITLTALSIYGYYKYNKIFPNTDNAYVNADVINISPKVGGYIEKVYVQNNQYIHKGDKLVQIDPKDYQLQVANANAKIIQAKGQLAVAQEQVSVAKSNLTKAQSSLDTATSMADRYIKLYKEDAGSLQDAQKYINQKIQAEKAKDEAYSSLKQALVQVEIAKAQVGAAKVGYDNASLNLSYTTLIAPDDGYVSNLKIYKGQLVSTGQPLFGFIDNKTWWIDANFKETDLDRIKPGQSVKIELDMYSHTYTGTVNSISYATGSVFSLLPPENATGNWVKVTQRFPVKIVLKNDPKYLLRVGASATVKVDTL
ncbi:HlyD family secretion protein [Francisella noatunensis]|uniref:HlyD family secretion protein n=1 Tax=Francisella noatunensis TaxID=657445 RepID=A0A9Q2KVW6_9GAMM|nr:HlyD family secretion protein [Francisella noatunensis]MBK2028444.1 HlyD family secretion protein [Francisella noatunensis]MBK2033841.1 HlyD family secretion protein [Francisella noatunensis]MBK2049345.1 HlyD family secretion protein [Francisella noatunensis]MBK2050810.1 HlyD family secretion protein [Francisella noatunensis]MBK2052086.1 HlyD family secretion protein [Francisella noatunensis]